MLPAAHRMRRSREFSHVVRSGRRAGRPTLVLHVAPGSVDEPTRVGLVVSRQVGGSVIRHQVARRLRAIAAAELVSRPNGELVVIRALAPASRATSAQLRADLAKACARVDAQRPESPGSR